MVTERSALEIRLESLGGGSLNLSAECKIQEMLLETLGQPTHLPVFRKTQMNFLTNPIADNANPLLHFYDIVSIQHQNSSQHSFLEFSAK